MVRALKTAYKLFSLQIGEGILSGVNSPWLHPPWRYFEYQDTGGSPSKELYWGEDGDKYEYTEESTVYVNNDKEPTGDYFLLFLSQEIDVNDDWNSFLEKLEDYYYDNVDTNDDDYNYNNDSKSNEFFLLEASPNDNVSYSIY